MVPTRRNTRRTARMLFSKLCWLLKNTKKSAQTATTSRLRERTLPEKTRNAGKQYERTTTPRSSLIRLFHWFGKTTIVGCKSFQQQRYHRSSPRRLRVAGKRHFRHIAPNSATSSHASYRLPWKKISTLHSLDSEKWNQLFTTTFSDPTETKTSKTWMTGPSLKRKSPATVRNRQHCTATKTLKPPSTASKISMKASAAPAQNPKLWI